MSNLERFPSFALLLAALLTPVAALAQGAPPTGVALPPAPPTPPAGSTAPAPPVFPATPLPAAGPSGVFPGTPLPPDFSYAPPPYPGPYFYAPPALELTAPPKKRWYGWQILAATAAADVTMIGSALGAGSSSSGNVAEGFFFSGVVAHAVAGPIVHLAHGHPLKALASFALEGVLPAAFILPALFTPCNEDVCAANVLVGIIGVPIALTAGLAIDTSALAWDDARPASEPRIGAFNPAFTTLGPLVLPPLRTGAAPSPVPAGVTVGGTF